MTPLRRVGRPDEVASTCLFLTSDEGAFVTGQVIDVAATVAGDAPAAHDAAETHLQNAAIRLAHDLK